MRNLLRISIAAKPLSFPQTHTHNYIFTHTHTHAKRPVGLLFLWNWLPGQFLVFFRFVARVWLVGHCSSLEVTKLKLSSYFWFQVFRLNCLHVFDVMAYLSSKCFTFESVSMSDGIQVINLRALNCHCPEKIFFFLNFVFKLHVFVMNYKIVLM